MASYLIAWKPASENKEKGWPEKNLIQLAETVLRDGSAYEPWRFSKVKGVRIGDRVFLIRQGKRGAAIIGYGRVATTPSGKNRQATVRFERLLDPRAGMVLANRDELYGINDLKKIWGAQSSGTTLPDEVGAALEALVVGRVPIPDSAQINTEGNDRVDLGWSDEELRASVSAYLEMLRKTIAGEKIVKANYYGALSENYGRAPKAFERRMMNISYVLSLMGREWIKGLLPATNVGANVGAKIERFIREIEGSEAPPVVAAEITSAVLQAKGDFPVPAGNPQPPERTVTSTQYERDLAVKAWVLLEAAGKCECCRQPSPFRRPDDTPYLEVHHVRQLANGGSDTVTNTVALCPNCHTEIHFGKRSHELAASLYNKVKRLVRE